MMRERRRDVVTQRDKSKLQDVRHIVGQLNWSAHKACKIHREVDCPWGIYIVLDEGSHFKIKRVVVMPGRTLSLQLHRHRSEHWVVEEGTAKLVSGNKKFFLTANESTYIPAGHRYRLSNPGVVDPVII